MKNKITYKSCEGYIEGMLQCGYTFLIDLEDYAIVSKYNWYKDGDGYLRNRNLGYMHRFLMETPEGKQTDHINRNKHDNRKENLRHVTQSENQVNKPHKSGKGIQKNHNCNTWTAQININKQRHYLGSFKTYAEALEARLEAERTLLN
jgi:hypothetical protein